MAYLIKTNGEMIEITPKNGKDFSGNELHNYVDGYFEIVSSPDSFFVLDEEGKLKGKSINIVATDFAHKCNAISSDDYLVGDVVFCNREEIK